jgi:hypothetical protein
MSFDFIISMPAFFWFEVLSLGAGLFCFNKLKRSFLIWFIPFLIFIVCVELFGTYINKVMHQRNAWVFNFSIPLEYLFYSYIFFETYVKPASKSFAKYGGCVYLLFCMITLLKGTLMIFHNPLLVAGNLLTIAYSCIYFYEVLRKEEIVNLGSEPMFWITCGVFLFNIGELTYTFFRPILTANKWDVTLAIFKGINNKLIFWLYGSITIGVLCTRLRRYRKTFDS